MKQLAHVLLAGIIWTGPKLAPADAAKILAASPGLANAANHPPPQADGPTFVIFGEPGALTALPFAAPTPDKRLDGTLLTRPLQTYGNTRYARHRR